MKCPRCKFVSNETADECPKCKFDLARYRSLLGLGGADGNGQRSGQQHGVSSPHTVAAESAAVAGAEAKATKVGYQSEDNWFTRYFGSSKGGAESREILRSTSVDTAQTTQVRGVVDGHCSNENRDESRDESRDDSSITDKLGDLFKEEKDASIKAPSRLASKPESSSHDTVSAEQFFDSLLDAGAEKFGVDLAKLAGLEEIGRYEVLTEMEESREELNNLEAELEMELELLSSEGTNLRVESVETDEQGLVATSQLEALERELERDLQDMVVSEEQEEAQSAAVFEQEIPYGMDFDEPLFSKDIEAELDAELKSLESEGFKFLSVESVESECQSCAVGSLYQDVKSQGVVVADLSDSQADESPMGDELMVADSVISDTVDSDTVDSDTVVADTVVADTVGDSYAELDDILAELATLEQEDSSQEQGGLRFLEGLSENELEEDGLSNAELQRIADRIAIAGKARLLDAMRCFEEETCEDAQAGLGSRDQEGDVPECDTYSSLEDLLAELDEEAVGELEEPDLTEVNIAKDSAVPVKDENDLRSETSSMRGATPSQMHSDSTSDTPSDTLRITQLQLQSSVVDILPSSLTGVNTVAMVTDVDGSALVASLWEDLSIELQSPHLRNEHRDFEFTDLAISHIGGVSQNPNTDLYFSELEDELLMGGRAGKARVREQFLRAREASISYSAELQDESINSAMQEALREVEKQECVVDYETTSGKGRSPEQRSGRLSRLGDGNSESRSVSADDGLLQEGNSYITAVSSEHSCPRALRVFGAQMMDVLLFLGLSLVLEVVFSVPKEMREAILRVSFQNIWVCDLLPHVADVLIRFTFLYVVCNTWLLFSSGQTLAQRFFGLFTCDTSGEVPGFSKAFVSSAAIAVYLLTFGLCALPIFGARRQMFGRYLSRTEIVDC